MDDVLQGPQSMDGVLQELNDLKSLRSIEKDHVEEELRQLRGTVGQLHNSVVSLTRKFSELETQHLNKHKAQQASMAPTAPWVAKDISFLKTEVSKIQGRVDSLEKTEGTKQTTVFGARLNTNEDLKDNEWKKINKCDIVYTPSTCFLQDTCSFKAPIDGDYYLDMAARQQGKGSLEVALVGTGTSKFKHSYVGNTTADSMVCHKTVIVSLNAGDRVHGIVRRLKGAAEINWSAYHGCLVTATPSITPSAPPPFSACAASK